MTRPRIKLATRYFFSHFCLSVLVAWVAALIIFFGLYPPPFSSVLDVWPIFFLLIGVDVILGPAITALLANPKKKREERNMDFLLVGVIQFLALAYGMHSVWLARPVALVFEKDRFVLVRANEIYLKPGVEFESEFKISKFGIIKVSTTDALDSAELMDSINLMGEGITTAMRPHRWQSFSASDYKIKVAAKKIEILEGEEKTRNLFRKARLKKHLPANAKYYIPLTTSQSYDWIVLLDGEFQIVSYLNVDGFQ